MDRTGEEVPFPGIVSALAVLAGIAAVPVARGQPTGFVEAFAGPGLSAPWSQAGNPASHPTVIDGTYDLTHAHGDLAGGTKLNRSTSGTAGAYTHEIEVVLDQHLLSGSPGTQTDFKWKSVGTDGLMEIVLNSFGHFRVNHFDFNTNNGDHIAGAHPDIIDIGYTDGDLLRITTDYDPITDTVDVAYKINDDAPVLAYAGGGIDGPIGDVITSFVEVEVFKFGDNGPEQTVASIDSWRLAPIDDVSADYSGDGVVDAADYTVWRDSLGQSVVPGAGADGNGSGVVDQPDYDYWEQHFRTVSGLAAGASGSVPEPGGCITVAWALALVSSHRNSESSRRRGRRR